MDDDMQKYLIPRYLDEPAKVLIFTMDEIAAIVVCGLAGLYLAHFAELRAPVRGVRGGRARRQGRRRDERPWNLRR